MRNAFAICAVSVGIFTSPGARADDTASKPHTASIKCPVENGGVLAVKSSRLSDEKQDVSMIFERGELIRATVVGIGTLNRSTASDVNSDLWSRAVKQGKEMLGIFCADPFSNSRFRPVSIKCPYENDGVLELYSKSSGGITETNRVSYKGNTALRIVLTIGTTTGQFTIVNANAHSVVGQTALKRSNAALAAACDGSAESKRTFLAEPPKSP